MTSMMGPDGIVRLKVDEDKLNGDFSTLFQGPLGSVCLEYLRSISINQYCGPEVSDAHLRHLEGMRFMVSVILKRIELGGK